MQKSWKDEFEAATVEINALRMELEELKIELQRNVDVSRELSAARKVVASLKLQNKVLQGELTTIKSGQQVPSSTATATDEELYVPSHSTPMGDNRTPPLPTPLAKDSTPPMPVVKDKSTGIKTRVNRRKRTSSRVLHSPYVTEKPKGRKKDSEKTDMAGEVSMDEGKELEDPEFQETLQSYIKKEKKSKQFGAFFL